MLVSARQHLDPVKAQQRSAEVRRERKEARQKTALDWAADVLQANGEELAGLILDAARRGDWRAAACLYARVYGSPKETVEQVNEEPEATQWLRQMTAEERRALMRRLHENPDEDAAAEG